MRWSRRRPMDEGSASLKMQRMSSGLEGSLLNRMIKRAVPMMVQQSRCIRAGVSSGFLRVFLIE